MTTSRSWMRRTALAGLAASALVFAGDGVGAQARPGFRIVVHPDNPVSQLRAEQLEALFLKRAVHWDDDTRAQPVDQPADTPVREAFSRVVLGRSARAMVAHWQQQIFSGRGVPPTELRGDRAVVEYVASHRGAIGYVSPSAAVEGVRVVEVRQ